MDNEELIKEFNKQGSEFLCRMSETFPNEEKIKEYKSMFDTMKIFSSKSTVKLFIDNLAPYGKQIMEKNELFFMDQSYVEHAESLSGKMGLVKYWKNLTPETKDAIWNYIQVLYILGLKSQGREDEIKKVMEAINNEK